MSFNRIILEGRLGADPRGFETDSGGGTNFSVATTETFKDKNGNKQERVSWHNIVAWSKLAELCSKYLVKGSHVLIEGKLQYRDHEKDGIKRTYAEVVASNVQFLGPKPEPTEPLNDHSDDSEIPF